MVAWATSSPSWRSGTRTSSPGHRAAHPSNTQGPDVAPCTSTTRRPADACGVAVSLTRRDYARRRPAAVARRPHGTFTPPSGPSPHGRDPPARVKLDGCPRDVARCTTCLLYTSDAADEEDSVDLGGRRIIKKKKKKK